MKFLVTFLGVTSGFVWTLLWYFPLNTELGKRGTFLAATQRVLKDKLVARAAMVVCAAQQQRVTQHDGRISWAQSRLSGRRLTRPGLGGTPPLL